MPYHKVGSSDPWGNRYERASGLTLQCAAPSGVLGLALFGLQREAVTENVDVEDDEDAVGTCKMCKVL